MSDFDTNDQNQTVKLSRDEPDVLVTLSERRQSVKKFFALRRYDRRNVGLIEVMAAAFAASGMIHLSRSENNGRIIVSLTMSLITYNDCSNLRTSSHQFELRRNDTRNTDQEFRLVVVSGLNRTEANDEDEIKRKKQQQTNQPSQSQTPVDRLAAQFPPSPSIQCTQEPVTNT